MKRCRVLLSLCAVAVVACNEPAPTTTPAPAPSSSGSAAAVVSTSTAAAKPTASSAAAVPDEESVDTWLVVNKGGIDLGIIELRRGKAPKLSLDVESEDSAALETRLKEIGGPEGIGLDMHLPPESGSGRGAYGTQIVKYDDRLYRYAVTDELEPTFSVKEVPAVKDPLPPAGVKRVDVSRSGERVGTLDFTSKPPKLTLHTDKADGSSLKSTWEQIEGLDPVKVRYHFSKDSVETLVIAEAKPGDASYAQTVILRMMTLHSYTARYAYKLEFSE